MTHPAQAALLFILLQFFFPDSGAPVAGRLPHHPLETLVERGGGMEAGERSHLRHPQALVVPEQIQRIHDPVIVHILPEVLPGETVDGLAQIIFVGIDRIGKVLQGERLHQEGPMFGHIPAAPVVQVLIDCRQFIRRGHSIRLGRQPGGCPELVALFAEAQIQQNACRYRQHKENGQNQQRQFHVFGEGLPDAQPISKNFYFLMVSNPFP